MKRTLWIIGTLAFFLCLGVLWSNIYSQIRTERIKTRWAFQLTEGRNRLSLALPEGHYVCVFADRAEVRPAATTMKVLGDAPTVVTSIMRGKQSLVTTTNGNWIKFYVSDNKYFPVEVETLVRGKSSENIYLNFGATF